MKLKSLFAGIPLSLLLLLMLTACGVSQSEFDAVAEKVDMLSAIVYERDNRILQLEQELAASSSEAAMLTAHIAELSEVIDVLDLVISDSQALNATTQGDALQEAWEGAAGAAREAGRAIRDAFLRAWNSPIR